MESLCARKCEILNKVDNSAIVFDPWPKQFQTCCPNRTENLCCDLLNLCDNGSAAFLTILMPSVANIDHNHSYACKTGEEFQSQPMQNVAEEDNEGNWTADLEENCRSDLCDVMFAEHQVAVIFSLCISRKSKKSWRSKQGVKVIVLCGMMPDSCVFLDQNVEEY